MNKLIFRKFSLDILNFFLIASFSITFIVWIIQAVNLLDLVSDDGHSLKIYFYIVSLNLPKIFSKIIVFVFFISIFYVINKYNNSNELLVFWNNGIRKIKFINLHKSFFTELNTSCSVSDKKISITDLSNEDNDPACIELYFDNDKYSITFWDGYSLAEIIDTDSYKDALIQFKKYAKKLAKNLRRF